jgi:hypothetical protein
MPLTIDFTLDPDTYRNSLNGHPVVMHSHHYLALITKLVEDMQDIGGPTILQDVVEETMRLVIDDYIQKHGVSSASDKCNVGREYFSLFGLGKMVVTGDENGGEVKLLRSHLDEGWVMKWGSHDKPINYVARGFIAAMFAAAFNKPMKSYSVTETESLVAGASESKFIVKAS